MRGASIGAIEVAPTLDEVSAALPLIVARLPERLSLEQRYHVEIGIAEALNNIVLHGRPGERDAITVDIVDEANGLRIEIRDRGAPIPAQALRSASQALAFDPADVANLPEGGLGLALLHAAFDTVEYEPRSEANVLRLAKAC